LGQWLKAIHHPLGADEPSPEKRDEPNVGADVVEHISRMQMLEERILHCGLASPEGVPGSLASREQEPSHEALGDTPVGWTCAAADSVKDSPSQLSSHEPAPDGTHEPEWQQGHELSHGGESVLSSGM